MAVSNLDANEIKKIRTLNTEPPIYDHASDSVSSLCRSTRRFSFYRFTSPTIESVSFKSDHKKTKKQKTGIPIVCIVRTLVVLLFDTIQRTPAHEKKKKKLSITEKTSRNRRGNKIHLGERFAIGNRSEETRKRKLSGGGLGRTGFPTSRCCHEPSVFIVYCVFAFLSKRPLFCAFLYVGKSVPIQIRRRVIVIRLCENLSAF